MSRKLGIIAGSAFLDGVDLPDTVLESVATPAGVVALHRGGDFILIRRHGETGYRPPHRVPHHAHVLALDALGVTHVAGFASTGSLRPDLPPGAVMVPADYISLHPPPTLAGDEYLHIVPALDPDVRALLLAAARTAVPGATIHGAGVYVQTHGPRFETAAEVRRLARDADVVGMTAASEATLCQERGIAYAMLCIVDNYANGVGSDPLTLEGFRAQLAANSGTARAIVSSLLDHWRSAS